MADNLVRIPDHFFISDEVLKESYAEKQFDKNAACFFLLFIKYRNTNREFFVRGKALTMCVDLNKNKAFQGGVLEALQGVELSNSHELSEVEYLIKLASRTGTKKSPQTLSLLVTPDEKADIDALVKSKGYNISVMSTTDLLAICGVDYPFSRNFMSQLSK